MLSATHAGPFLLLFVGVGVGGGAAEEPETADARRRVVTSGGRTVHAGVALLGAGVVEAAGAGVALGAPSPLELGHPSGGHTASSMRTLSCW